MGNNRNQQGLAGLIHFVDQTPLTNSETISAHRPRQLYTSGRPGVGLKQFEFGDNTALHMARKIIQRPSAEGFKKTWYAKLQPQSLAHSLQRSPTRLLQSTSMFS